MRARLSVLTCLTACLVAAGFGVASGQTVRGGTPQAKTPAPAASQPTAASPVSEQPFVSQAAMANMAEIQIGHMAVKKAQSDAVRMFAGMMVDDHIKAQNALADAARGAGIQWPKALDDKHAALRDRLSSLNGADFDREYMKAMVAGHHDVEKALAARAAESGGENDDVSGNVTEWSAKTLPAVRAHLKKAEEVSAQLEQGRSTRSN